MGDTTRRLTHIVLLGILPSVGKTELERVFTRVRDLSSIEGVRGIEVGPDRSIENLAAGFTHAIVVTLDDTASRDRYLNSPSHLEVADELGPLVQRIVVVDV